MAQKKINYELLTWTLLPYLFISSYCQEKEERGDSPSLDRPIFCLSVGLCRGVDVLVSFYTCVLGCSTCSDAICLHFHAYKSFCCY